MYYIIRFNELCYPQLYAFSKSTFRPISYTKPGVFNSYKLKKNAEKTLISLRKREYYKKEIFHYGVVFIEENSKRVLMIKDENKELKIMKQIIRRNKIEKLLKE